MEAKRHFGASDCKVDSQRRISHAIKECDKLGATIRRARVDLHGEADKQRLAGVRRRETCTGTEVALVAHVCRLDVSVENFQRRLRGRRLQIAVGVFANPRRSNQWHCCLKIAVVHVEVVDQQNARTATVDEQSRGQKNKKHFPFFPTSNNGHVSKRIVRTVQKQAPEIDAILTY